MSPSNSSDIPSLTKTELTSLEPLLRTFTTRHQSHHKPIALVTSGGTAADLELQSVRFLDNFSTGLRGAISVEEFCKRGYAVIHLWRVGSAAPYSRILSSLLGCQAGNHGLGFDALGRLFQGQGSDEFDDNDDDDPSNNNNDPWLTSTNPTGKHEPNSTSKKRKSDLSDDRMNLSRRIRNSSELETKLRERQAVVENGLLLTIPYRTVEEYLAKLKLCSEALRDSQSLGLVYLAAAVRYVLICLLLYHSSTGLNLHLAVLTNEIIIYLPHDVSLFFIPQRFLHTERDEE